MYIIAAVDVDVREVTKAAKARAASSGGFRWKRGEGDGDVHVHEQVVCSIKAHQNGTLEIAPGRYLRTVPLLGWSRRSFYFVCRALSSYSHYVDYSHASFIITG